ncbi:MAG TPA: hypothetical protein VFW49_03940 [Fluviicoccus sp.]|nr:hypothetical protein [Fluviicoccus sp.]
MTSNKSRIDAVRAALSPARLATYEVAAGVQGDGDLAALELYAWNAEISSALLVPLHVCEVVIRNTVADALEPVYGARWPWSTTFERSLPDPQQGYSPRRDLQSARRSSSSTGKVIPELKFVFWQKMFTSRYDERIWDAQLRRVLPNMSQINSVAELRLEIYKDLEQLRKLRNRIAHHEPVFNRNMADDYARIRRLVACRCKITADWLEETQRVVHVINSKP